ncbi:hypothetical protein [Marinobacter sp.]|uniref:hypothetical protein n=1 Tax=Marinobacter sp. TaxID=50741 RepID=UPI0035C68076|nr:hypothetical protein [Oleiphilaceae bacterium]
MVEGLVAVTQVGLLALILLMAFQVMTLVRSAPLTGTVAATPPPVVQVVRREPATVSAGDRAELYTQLHILAGLQERDCRSNGLDLTQAPAAVKGYAVTWLYGAACALCGQSARHSGALTDLVGQIGHRKLGVGEAEALRTIDALTGSTVQLACYRSGLEGAEFWREHQYVSPRQSLYTAITSNAFI